MVSLRLYAIVSFAGFGLTWASGIYLVLIGYRGNPAECATACWNGITIEAIGILMAFTFGLKALLRFLAGPGHVALGRAESQEIGSGPQDQNILAVANELLSNQRRRRRRNVLTLAWSNTIPWNWPGLGPQGLRKPPRLVLPVELRNKLDLDDWRILLNYSLLQNRFPNVHVLAPIIWSAVPVLLFLEIAATLSFTLGQHMSALFGAIVGPGVIIFFLFHLGPAFREMWLRSDIVAARTLGNSKLLGLFEKVDRLQLSEIENAKRRQGWAARLWPMPNIIQRIENISGNRAIG